MGEAYHIKDEYGTYFLTFQVVNWIDIFTRQRYRDIIVNSFNHCIREKGLTVCAWVIMSNHVHCILRSNRGKLSDTVRDFKSYTSKQIIKSITEEWESRRDWLLQHFRQAGMARHQQYQVWTHENHALLMEPQMPRMLYTRINYIHQNPVRAGIVHQPEDYIYSSAGQYHSGKKGIIDTEVVAFLFAG